MAEQTIPQEQISDLLDAYPKERRWALPAMQDMQRKYNYVPRYGLEALAEHLGCTLASLYSIVTFYKALSLKPKGKHIIRICDGTACHIRGAVNLIGGIYRTLGIGPGETTEDGEFSLETVNCLGSCALAPAMVIDGRYYSKVTMESLPGVFKSVSEEAAL